jgi:hypothetical protein
VACIQVHVFFSHCWLQRLADPDPHKHDLNLSQLAALSCVHLHGGCESAAQTELRVFLCGVLCLETFNCSAALEIHRFLKDQKIYLRVHDGPSIAPTRRHINPLTPELNPSSQRCLTRFLLGILLLEPVFRSYMRENPKNATIIHSVY